MANTAEVARARVAVVLDKSNFSKASASIHKDVGKLKKSFVSLGSIIKVAFSAFLIKQVKNFASSLDDLGKSSKALNLTATRLDALRQTAGLFAISTAGLTKALFKLQTMFSSSSTGIAQNQKAFDALNLSYDALIGKSVDEKLLTISDAWVNLSDGTEEAGVASALFGERIGLTLLPMLREGGAGLRKYLKEIEATSAFRGGTESIETMNDSIALLFSTLNRSLKELLASVAPLITRLSDIGRTIIAVPFVDKFLKWGTALLVFTGVSYGAVKAAGMFKIAWAAAFKINSTSKLTAPFRLMAGAITGARASLKKLFTYMSRFAKNMKATDYKGKCQDYLKYSALDNFEDVNGAIIQQVPFVDQQKERFGPNSKQARMAIFRLNEMRAAESKYLNQIETSYKKICLLNAKRASLIAGSKATMLSFFGAIDNKLNVLTLDMFKAFNVKKIVANFGAGLNSIKKKLASLLDILASLLDIRVDFKSLKFGFNRLCDTIKRKIGSALHLVRIHLNSIPLYWQTIKENIVDAIVKLKVYIAATVTAGAATAVLALKVALIGAAMVIVAYGISKAVVAIGTKLGYFRDKSGELNKSLGSIGLTMGQIGPAGEGLFGAQIVTRAKKFEEAVTKANSSAFELFQSLSSLNGLSANMDFGGDILNKFATDVFEATRMSAGFQDKTLEDIKAMLVDTNGNFNISADLGKALKESELRNQLDVIQETERGIAKAKAEIKKIDKDLVDPERDPNVKKIDIIKRETRVSQVNDLSQDLYNRKQKYTASQAKTPEELLTGKNIALESAKRMLTVQDEITRIKLDSIQDVHTKERKELELDHKLELRNARSNLARLSELRAIKMKHAEELHRMNMTHAEAVHQQRLTADELAMQRAIDILGYSKAQAGIEEEILQKQRELELLKARGDAKSIQHLNRLYELKRAELDGRRADTVAGREEAIDAEEYSDQTSENRGLNLLLQERVAMRKASNEEERRHVEEIFKIKWGNLDKVMRREERGREYTLADLRLQIRYHGKDNELKAAQMALQRRQALENAKSNKERISIGKEYALRKKLDKLTQQKIGTESRVMQTSKLSGLIGFGSKADPVAKNTAELVGQTRKSNSLLERIIKNGNPIAVG